MTITYGECALINDDDLFGKVDVATLNLQCLGKFVQLFCLSNLQIFIFALWIEKERFDRTCTIR